MWILHMLRKKTNQKHNKGEDKTEKKNNNESQRAEKFGP